MVHRFLLACLVLSSSLALSAGSAATAPPPPVPVDLPEPIPAPIQTVVKSKDISKKVAVLASMVLAFNSGYSNGCCLGTGVGGTKQAVAAVTGAWTTSAYGLASGNMKAFSVQIRAIASYMGGSAIAGAMIPKPVAFKLSETTGPTFLVGAALMFAASHFAERSSSGMTCFYLALMANGLQNSVTSVHTANLCRSAHFSGITSDMGTFLGQLARGNKENIFKLKVFALLGLSFWTGGFSSYFITQKLPSKSLYLGAAIHLLIGLNLIIRK